MPCCKIIMSKLPRNSAVEKLKQVFRINNTISKQIAELSENIFMTCSLKDTNFKVMKNNMAKFGDLTGAYCTAISRKCGFNCKLLRFFMDK